MFQTRDPGPQVFNTPTEFYNLVAPQVADDNSVLAFTGTRTCNGGSSCLAVQTIQGTVVDSSGQEILRAFGYVNISPSGQWAVFSGRNTFESPSLSGAELVDLSTGMQIHMPYSFYGPTRRRIADDGTIAFFDSGAIVLWRSDGQQAINDPALPSATPYPEPALMISNDGMRVVYQNSNGLVLYDRVQAAGFTVASGNPTSVTISDDGRTIAWIGEGSQIGIASPTGVDLPAISEGVAEVALSGDGQLLFAATKNGRILTIQLPLGTTTELNPRTPSITNPPNNYPYYPLMGIFAGVSAGSLVIISGTGLSDLTMSATSPTTGALVDVRILIGGMDVPVEAISPSLIWFQVPWELAPQDYPLQYLSGNSPFETSPTTITVKSTAPQFLRNADGLVTAVHGDWSGLVEWPNLARPGELIYVYMTGLGPVNPPVPTGAATPDMPLSYVAGSLTCQFFGNTVFDAHDATVQFAGLAPEMVGIYQVSLQVPEGLFGPVPEYTFGIGCGFGSNFPGGIIGVIPSN